MPSDRDQRRPGTGAGRPVPREVHDGNTSGVYDNPLEEIVARSRKTHRTVSDTQVQLRELTEDIGTLARHVLAMEGKVLQIDEGLDVSNDKLDRLVENAEEERETREARKEVAREEREAARKRREEREEREAARKLEEMKLRSADRKQNITLAGVIISVLFGGVATVIAATKGDAPQRTTVTVPVPTPVPVPVLPAGHE